MIKDLHKYVDTDFAMCIQWDAFILNPDAWEEDFLSYDYIGAPWWFSDDRNVGNGGFSIRSRKFLEVASTLPLKNFNPEDLVLCRTYRNLLLERDIRFAPEALAAKFSREGNQKYGRTWKGEFGFHDFEMTDVSAWSPPLLAKFKVIYRICDKKPTTQTGISKITCLENFLKAFDDVPKEDILILADNSSYQLIEKLNTLGVKYQRSTLGNAGALKKALELAMEYDDDDIVYLVEDDFLHLPGARTMIEQGLHKVDYVTLYDHLDKYVEGPNPYVDDFGERTKVFVTKSSHWKLTNSTVQTFAAKAGTLKEDKEILYKYNFEGETPDSFKTFVELHQNGRLLASCIPGRATHCHDPWQSPFIDWNGVANG